MNDSLIISKRPVKGRVISKPSTFVLPVETPVIQVDSNMSDEYSNLLELNKLNYEIITGNEEDRLTNGINAIRKHFKKIV